jgi:hypothetical protein
VNAVDKKEISILVGWTTITRYFIL